jgi:hypothetical protein
VFYTNIIVITTKFLYEHIFIKFGCLLTIVINQGTHFINDVIKYLTDHLSLDIPMLLFIIQKEMDKVNLQTRFLKPFNQTS